MSIQYTADQLQRKFRGPPGSPGFSRLADVLRQEGRLDEAIQLCQDGLSARPNTLSGYVVLGKALMDAGRDDQAREQFETALRLDPRCLSAMHFLARLMTKLQWGDAAAGYYRSILEVEPWDSQIRDLLGEAAPQARAGSGGISIPSTVSDSAPSAPYAPAPPDFSAQRGAPESAHVEEDTFQKPDGFSGDVMEINLNDLAADFLPNQDATSLGLEEESLEDALAASQAPGVQPPRFDAPPAMPAEPRPLDVLKDAPVDPSEELEGDRPPISGQDVEDRLDSLFGVEEVPAPSLRDATATWSPAPAEAPGPEIPPAPDFSVSDSEGSATATGELRAAETGEMPIRTEAEEIPGVQDFSAVDFETPLEQRAPADVFIAPADDPAAEDRVHGEDIERRLDELFHLTEEDNRPPTETSSLPVAPSPKVGEAVGMGEAVSFGGDVVFQEPGSENTIAADLEIPEVESLAAEIPLEESVTAVDDAVVTGQDVADKLDTLFGMETEAPAESHDADAHSAFTDTATATVSESPAASGRGTHGIARESPSEPKPWPVDDTEAAQPPPTGDVMSTESMLPPGWFGEAGDGPRITGADVEAQLDKLFDMEGEGDAMPAGAHEAPDLGNSDNTLAYQDPEARAAEQAAQPMPGDEADLTVMMPAMRDPSAIPDAPSDPGTPAPPKDTAKIKDSVADWLARRTDDADQRSARDRATETHSGTLGDAGDTLILPAGEAGLPIDDAQALRDFDATLELPSSARETALGALQDEPDSFDTLAPEDAAALTDTTSIEMVDGDDVAGRLDELFADEGNPADGTASLGKLSAVDAAAEAAVAAEAEMSLFIQENGEGLDVSEAENAEAVSGEDVSSRLQQMFDGGDLPGDYRPSQPEMGVAVGSETGAAGSETDEDMLPAVDFVKPAAQAAPDLAPMTDEDDGYPEEDEMPAQTGAGANVATVTLAEIYFQQGLREQALQIYRQLLEREPENDAVRKRIEEIEATKPDGGNGGPGSDPRRPRPGLKVPKRKK